MKYFKKCQFCKRRRFWVGPQKIKLPIGEIAVSKKDMCRHCANKVELITNQHGKQEEPV